MPSAMFGMYALQVLTHKRAKPFYPRFAQATSYELSWRFEGGFPKGEVPWQVHSQSQIPQVLF